MYEEQVDRSHGENIEKFNSINDPHFLIKGAGFIEDFSSIKYNYMGRILYSRYYGSNHEIVDVHLNGQNGLIEIHIPRGIILQSSFDFYVHYYHSGNVINALKWETDPRINIPKPQAIQVPPQYQYIQQSQDWPCQSPPPTSLFQGYPKPTIDIDFVMDNSAPKHYLKLEDCIQDKDSLVFKLPKFISHKSDNPFSTTFLLSLGLWSGITSKRYQVAYADERTVSTGLYVAGEQNSGAGKSLAMNILLEPFSNRIQTKISEIISSIQIYDGILDELNESLAGCTTKEDRAYNRKQKEKTKNHLKYLNKKLHKLQNLAPITNVTSPALNSMLIATNGFFFAASSENGLFISILGLRDNPKFNDNDLLLNAREGGYVNNIRANRNAYRGQARGAITSYAQEGGIGYLLSASGNTGLAERFLLISEPSLIGYRDRIKEKINGEHILEEYAKRCAICQAFIDDDNALNHEALITLKITVNGWRYIAHFEQDLENKMRPGAELSHPILQRVVGKTKMQVMGIAANMYLLHTENPPANESDDPSIPDEFVVMGINIFKKLIFGVRSYCERKGLISDVPQLTAVYNAFIGKGDNVSYSDQELKKRLQQVKPFKDITEESPRKVIQRAIDYLVQHHVLLIDNNGRYFRNPEKFVPTYQ
ncbi:DUF3987 domain-containing protein [Methylomonas koyamae]|uniref:DUF3987 domain-containing protein n=1 Tax=Methylomonas koyamae TaxID=702114 RepID=UPI0006D0654C|nr:DUF3987 domain-containing protein [Methylomonas koyamae]BBL58863.1 hypothetical protein MKFW12EY_24760 [Methylomonas koyamae]